MTPTSENRLAVTATVVSLTAEATELETHVTELREALAALDEQIGALSNALHQIHRSAVPSSAATNEEHSGGDRTE
ncbi:hypothetical protein [Streptomyces sp. NPDC001970]